MAIITPKATIPSWRKVAAGFGIEPLLVTNYEQVRRGKLPECSKRGKGYKWNLPEDTLLIFDECQKCKGRTSQNAALLVALGLADESYGDWFRWSVKFQLMNLVLTSAILLFGLAVGY